MEPSIKGFVTLGVLCLLAAPAGPLVAQGHHAGHGSRTEGVPGAGALVIVGGALSRENADVYGAMLAARSGEGPFCVVPTAGGDPAASTASAVGTISRHAAGHPVVGLDLSLEKPERAHDPAAAAEIRACSGFFFTGGVQSRVLDFFLPQGDTTVAYRALWGRWQEGAVVAGSSAGAAMMSRVMIASGASAGAIESGVSESGGDEEEDGGGVSIRPGMGFYADALLDQHFLARGRIGRLLVAVLATDSVPVGFGIDENTSLVVAGDQATVVGASGVIVVDGRGAERVSSTRGRGMVVSLAGNGDVVDLGTLGVRHGAGKVPVPVTGGAPTLPEDPFARWAFLHLLRDLAGSPQDGARFQVGDAVLSIRKAHGFQAVMKGAEGGVQGTPAGLSAGPFLVDLLPGG